MIVGICGLISSGKNTVAEIFVDEFGFQQESFAAPLKDAVAAVFGWDRLLLEGATEESRAWRDTVDKWWADRLQISHLTPRWVLQHWGTDVLRSGFHDDLWIAACERRLLSATTGVVISDLRFPNEFAALRKLGATIIRVKRGADPEWFEAAITVNTAPLISPERRSALAVVAASGVHESEWAWAGQRVDFTLDNTGSLDDLRTATRNIAHTIGIADIGAT